MSSDESFVKYIVDQIQDAGVISYKKMFGEYGIYCNGKIAALVCDDQLFVKITDAGRSFVGVCVEASPYPGAKPSFRIDDQCDDSDFLTELFSITAAHLPEPKRKKKKKK